MTEPDAVDSAAEVRYKVGRKGAFAGFVPIRRVDSTPKKHISPALRWDPR